MRLQFPGALWLAAAAVAGPPLTTIQDTLYKADGSRFSGIVQVQWTSFEASDRSQIATQSLTVKVVDGVLRVKLVPTTNATPPAVYAVKYNSDGRVQFEERWAVPPSAATLRVSDVRTTMDPPASTSSGTIEQSDVAGLVADLSARPMKGSGYAGGRAAVINAEGHLEAATGAATDCIRVDGSAAPCAEGESGGGAAPGFVDGEAPAGIVDGANRVFTLAAPPLPQSSLEVYRNGIRQKAGFDYSLSGNTVEFAAEAVPQGGDTLLASYRVSAGEGVASVLIAPAAEVLCSAAGGAIWSCAVPALVPGDRIDIKFDYQAEAGAPIQLVWAGATLVQRIASAAAALSGRVEIAITQQEARWSTQVWGGGSLEASAGTCAAGTGAVEFRGAGLRTFTVVRYPARQ